MSRLGRVGAATLTVTFLTLFSFAVQANARIAWTAAWGGPLSIVSDDGVSGRRVVAPEVTGFELAPGGDAVVYSDLARVAWLLVLDAAAPIRLPEGTHDDFAGVGGVAWSPDGRELAIARQAPGVGGPSCWSWTAPGGR